MLDSITFNKDILIPILNYLDTKDMTNVSAASKTLRQAESIWTEISSRFQIENSKEKIIKYLNSEIEAPIYYFSYGKKIHRIQHNSVRCYPTAKLNILADVFKNHNWDDNALPETCQFVLDDYGQLMGHSIIGQLQPALKISALISDKQAMNPLFFTGSSDNLPVLVSSATLDNTLQPIREQQVNSEIGPFGFFSLEKLNCEDPPCIGWRSVERINAFAKDHEIIPQSEVGSLKKRPVFILDKLDDIQEEMAIYPQLDSPFVDILF